jgi:hypothetical protein
MVIFQITSVANKGDADAQSVGHPLLRTGGSEMKRSALSAVATFGLACSMLMGSAYAGDQDGEHDLSRYLTHINPKFMITPQQAFDWARFKSKIGPTYGGTSGAMEWMNFIETNMQEFGAVDLVIQDMPYNHYIVNDWPDMRTHEYGSGVEVEKLVSDGTPVQVVASYGMTSGFTPATGVTAPMLYYDPSHPPSKAQITGKILVFQTVPYTAAVPNVNPPYNYPNSFLTNYTYTDFEYQTPGEWFPMFTAVPPSVSSSYHSRWVWSQLNGFATIGMNGGQATAAAGIIVVYDYSPAAAFGIIQRSVYSLNGSGGVGTTYINVPTLCLDRVNGAKVLADAQAGKTATLTLNAQFETQTARWVLGYLPGKDFGTPQDQQILLATHTDAMSLVEEDGALGMLGIMHYMNHIPQSQRPKTLIFWFDSRHFMPGAEGAWSQYDYYLNNPQLLKPIVATMGMEHMGGRSTIEIGPDGNDYVYSPEGPNAGGLITSFIDVNNNNIWFIDTIRKAAENNNWPRVEASSGNVAPGVNGGYQKQVLSPVNKGRSYNPQIPGIGLAGDWPGAWTQEYSQLRTEAPGFPGFDKDYFVAQVAGLAQIAGEMMAKENLPIVLDFGWGQIASGLTCTLKSICTTSPPTGLLPDSGFVTPADAPQLRKKLVRQYESAFHAVERGAYADATKKLQELEASITSSVLQPNQTALIILINNQIAKLASL